MSSILKKILFFVGVIAFFCLVYKVNYPTYSWNQKLTVEVETPEGVASGSSVVAVKWRQNPDVWQEIRSVRDSHEGEATMVELPDGKYLFALLANDTPSLALHVFATSKVGSGMDSRIVPASEVSEHLGETRPISQEHYPLLVTFDDLDDPASVKRVDPDDLAASFGEGYSLNSITLEITDEDMTEGHVQNVLDYFWWPEERQNEYSCRVYKCGRNPIRIEFPNQTIDALTILDFSRGSK